MCLSYKDFHMFLGERDGYSVALSLRAILASCMVLLFVIFLFESFGWVWEGILLNILVDHNSSLFGGRNIVFRLIEKTSLGGGKHNPS